MRAKIVNQSSDFPVRRTGSYHHKKSTDEQLKTNTVPHQIRALGPLPIPISSHSSHMSLSDEPSDRYIVKVGDDKLCSFCQEVEKSLHYIS